MIDPNTKDNLTDIAENLPDSNQEVVGEQNNPEIEVVDVDGDTVTLGEESSNTSQK